MTLPAPSDPRLVRWRYHFTDFRLGRLIATLPMTGVSLGDVLSGPASGSGTVPLPDAVLARDPFGATIPRRTCMWAERQEILPDVGVVASEVPWAGIVMRRQRQHAGRAMKLDMVTFPSYWQRRLSPGGTFRQVDKYEIFRTMLAAGVTQPAVASAPTLPVTSPHMAGLTALTGPTSGVLADRTYLASDLKPILELLTELSSSGEGFDWRIVPRMAVPQDLTTLGLRLDLGYPRLGRVAPVDLRWSTDPADRRQRWGHVEDLTIVEDGSSVNNRVTAVGGGTGDDQIRAVADSTDTARDEMAAGYPVFESALSSSATDDRTFDTVYGKALGALLSGFASEVQVSGIKVRGDLHPTVTSYALGDDITVRVGGTPGGQPVTIIGQLIGRTIQPAGQGDTEQVTLDIQGAVAG